MIYNLMKRRFLTINNFDGLCKIVKWKYTKRANFIRQSLKKDVDVKLSSKKSKNYFTEHDLPLENILACATDREASMTVRIKVLFTF